MDNLQDISGVAINTYNSNHIVVSVGNHYKDDLINTDVIYTPNKGINWYDLKAGFNFSNIKRVMILGDSSAEKFFVLLLLLLMKQMYMLRQQII